MTDINLLANPSFEADWEEEKSHRVIMFRRDTGETIDTAVGNVFAPPGWVVWARTGFDKGEEYNLVEAGDAHKSLDAIRVHSGLKAYKLFKTDGLVDCGLMQRVYVGRAARVRAQAYGHCWSMVRAVKDSHPACYNNAHCSAGVGYGKFLLHEGDIPPLNGDPWNDAIGNEWMMVGIDPQGRLDPYTTGIIWGERVWSYNEHNPLPPAVCTAEEDYVTIILRAKNIWRSRNCDSYWDDASLVVLEEPPPPRGKPRVQYARTYVLLPQNADAAWAQAVVSATWDGHRYTIGSSADDAGIGNLDTRSVIAINPREWDNVGDDGYTNTIEEFFPRHYPGVDVKYVSAATPDELRAMLSPSIPIGINDPMNQGAGQWMVENSVKGILYIPWAIDYNTVPFDFSAIVPHGVDVYVNLRFSWASADDGQGTLPLLVHEQRFREACIGTIAGSKGVTGWSLTNEANSPREFPVLPDGNTEPITPARLAAFFASVREGVPDAKLSLGGFDPFNVESGLDPRQWTEQTWGYLGAARPDYVDVHGYIRGPDATLIGSDGKFADSKLSWQYLNFPKCYETLLSVLPPWAERLPVIVSEFNHLFKTVEPDHGWVNDVRAADVIAHALSHIETRAESGPRTRGIVLYRWAGDAWAIQGNNFIEDLLKEIA